MTEPVATEAQACTKCGHSDGINSEGLCNHRYAILGEARPNLCPCHCEFPAPQVEGAQTEITAANYPHGIDLRFCRKCGSPVMCLAVCSECGSRDLSKEIHFTATPQPTPADEELARETARDATAKICNVLNTQYPAIDWPFITIQELILSALTTALAEARRAQGTPTTDARAEAEAIVNDHIRLYGGVVVAEDLRDAVASALSSTPSEQKESDVHDD